MTEKLGLMTGRNPSNKGFIVLSHPALARTWIETGLLESILRRITISILEPSSQTRKQSLGGANRDMSQVLDTGPKFLERIYGPLLWTSSRNSTVTIKSQRKRLLFGECSSTLSGHWFCWLRHFVTQLFLKPQSVLIFAVPFRWSIAKFLIHADFVISKKRIGTSLSEAKGLVVASVGYEPWREKVFLYCKRNGIPVLYVPDNWDNATSKNVFAIFPDHLATMGVVQAKNLQKEIGQPALHCVPIGLPRFLGLARPSKKIIQPSSESKVPRILYLGYSLPYLERKTVNKLLSELKINADFDFELWYRPHPVPFKRHVPDVELSDEIRLHGDKHGELGKLPTLNAEYEDMFSNFDVVVSTPTTLALEFGRAGVPVIIDNCDDNIHTTTPARGWNRFSHLRDLADLGLPSGGSPRELARLIIGVLDRENSEYTADWSGIFSKRNFEEDVIRFLEQPDSFRTHLSN